MRIILQSSLYEPNIDDYHDLKPGHGYLSFNSSHSSGNKHFIAHVKLENGMLGSLMIPIHVMATKEFLDDDGKPLKYRSRYAYFSQDYFPNFATDLIAFMNSRIKAVENWLDTPEADKDFHEMYHCEANRYFGVPQ